MKESYLHFNKPLTNIDLNNMCNALDIPLKAILMKNEVKRGMPDGCYIINLDDSTGGGTHWTGYLQKNKEVCYFDSYGVYPPQDLFEIFQDENTEITSNPYDIQDYNSILCGYYVVGLFLHWKHKGINDIEECTVNYIKQFDLKQTKKNDAKIKKYIMNYFS